MALIKNISNWLYFKANISYYSITLMPLPQLDSIAVERQFYKKNGFTLFGCCHRPSTAAVLLQEPQAAASNPGLFP